MNRSLDQVHGQNHVQIAFPSHEDAFVASERPVRDPYAAACSQIRMGFRTHSPGKRAAQVCDLFFVECRWRVTVTHEANHTWNLEDFQPVT
jgi:hypothetical protein